MESVSPSNGFFVTPLQQLNLLLVPAPGLPLLAKRLCWLGVNFASLPIEWACRTIASRYDSDSNVARCLRSNPLGYAALFTKV